MQLKYFFALLNYTKAISQQNLNIPHVLSLTTIPKYNYPAAVAALSSVWTNDLKALQDDSLRHMQSERETDPFCLGARTNPDSSIQEWRISQALPTHFWKAEGGNDCICNNLLIR